MSPTYRLAAALLLPLALIAASCGDSTRKAPLADWVDGLCRAAAALDRDRDAALETFTSADLTNTAAAKQVFATTVEKQREAQKTFRTAVNDLGQPDIDGGKEVVKAFQDQFKENDQRTDDVAKRVAAIPDRADFLAEFQRIVDQAGEPDFRAKLVLVAKDHPRVNDLIAAIDKDPDCSRVIFSASPAANPQSEAWVSGVCTALGTWIDALSTGADSINRKLDAAQTPAEVKRILVDFFEQGLADTRALDRALKRLDPPPVRDGKEINRVFVTAGEDLVAAMERLNREVRSADFSTIQQADAEAARFIALIDQLFGDVAASFDELQQYDPEGLDVLFQELPECQF